MGRIIRLTESELINVIKNIIKENDDYKDRSMYDPYYDDEDQENQGDEGMMSDEDWENWGKPTPDQGMMSDEDWDNWGKPTPDQDMEISDEDVDSLPPHLKSVRESNLRRVNRRMIKENKGSLEREARIILNKLGYGMTGLKEDTPKELAKKLRQESKDRFGKKDWEKLADKLED